MPHLDLESPWFGQPDRLPRLDTGGLGADVQMLLLPMDGALVDVVNGRVWTRGGNASASKGTPQGVAATFDGVDDFFSFTGYPEIVGNTGTFFLWMPRVGVYDANGHVYLGSNTTSSSWFQLDVSHRPYVFGSLINVVGPDIRSSSNRSLVFSSDGTAASKAYFVDGTLQASGGAGAPVAFAAGNKTFRFGAWAGGGLWDCDMDCVVAGFSRRVWSAADARAFHEAPWLLFEPEITRVYWPGVGGGGATNLVIQEALHAHAADNLTLTQEHALTIAEALHAHTADNLTLAVAGTLEVADAAHAHTADNLALTQTHILAIAEAAHAHVADNIDLTQTHVLAVAEALHAHYADQADVTTATILSVNDGAHAHTADNLALTQEHLLAIADSVHAHLADNITLTQAHVLAILEAMHAHAADSLTLTIPSDNVWDEVLEGGLTARELMRLMAAALLGKASGMDTNTPAFRDIADSKVRINASVDAHGNRNSVTLDPS